MGMWHLLSGRFSHSASQATATSGCVQPLEQRLMLAVAPAFVKDICPGVDSSSPSQFVEMNGALYFRAYDGLHGSGLWRTDGTRSGTFRVAPAGLGDGWFTVDELTVVDGELYFRGSAGGQDTVQLWKSDGTAAGTVRIKEIRRMGNSDPYGFTYCNGAVYFVADNGLHGAELWRTDGTEAGTVMVKDIAPGHSAAGIGQLCAVGNTLFFRASEYGSSSNVELWKSDGTEGGTIRVRDINTSSWAASSDPGNMVNLNGVLLFSARDSTGYKLWRSDGTEAGTVIVKDPSTGGPSSAGELVYLNANTLLFSGIDGTAGRELWRTDGTPEGTQRVLDIRPGSASSAPMSLVSAEGTVYFMANDGVHGLGLWKSDGTGAGTVLVKGFGSLYGNAALIAVDDSVGLTVLNGSLKTEVWASDGTAAGTVKVAGPLTNSVPTGSFGTQLFYAGSSTSYGTELYRFETDPLRTPVAKAGGPYSVGEGGTLRLWGYASPDATVPLSYAWDLDGDGVLGETGPGAARGDEVGLEPMFNAAGLDGPGAFPVSFRISDSTGYVSTDTVYIRIENVSPAISFTGPSTGTEGEPCTVSFSAVDPGADCITEWIVDWGDGAVEKLDGDSRSASHVYADGPWTYGVRLTARDEDGTYSADQRVQLDAGFANGGKLITYFSSHTDETEAVAVQADGKVITAGRIWRSSSPGEEILITRYNRDGSLDSTFGTGGNTVFNTPGIDVADFPADLAIQADGKILVAGGWSDVPYAGDAVLLRLNTDGSLDKSFDGDGWLTADFGGFDGFNRVAILSDGRILVGGGNSSEPWLAQYDSSGHPDNTFGAGGRLRVQGAGDGPLRDMLVQADGRIVLIAATAGDDFCVARLLPDGTVDSSFGGGIVRTDFGGKDSAAALALQPDGRILAGGIRQTSDFYNQIYDLALARYNPDGTLDSSFDEDGRTLVFNVSRFAGLCVLPDGRILAASTRVAGMLEDFLLHRLLPNGKMDRDFGSNGALCLDLGGKDSVADMAIRSDGAIHLVGTSFQYGTRGAVARLIPDGLSIALTNRAPTLTLNGLPSADEGSAYVLGLQGSDPGADVITGWTISWGDGTVQTLSGRSPLAQHVYVDDGVYTIMATATDEDGTYAAEPFTLTVSNLAPTVGPITGPVVGVRGGDLTFSGAFTDAGIRDSHVIWWDFGDGTVTDPLPAGDPGALLASHTYAVAGTYTVRLYVRDNGGAVGWAAHAVTISPAVLLDDPIQPGKSALLVGGTSERDSIWVAKRNAAGDVDVWIDGACFGPFRPTGHIIVRGFAGDDEIGVDGAISVACELHGDSGSDWLKGGHGDDVLLGDGGDDVLLGGGGHDLLVGGAGKDELNSSSGGSILIGGSTVYDQSRASLWLIMAEWTRADVPYSQRVNHLVNGGGLSGDVRLDASSIIDDAALDRSRGGADDWLVDYEKRAREEA